MLGPFGSYFNGLECDGLWWGEYLLNGNNGRAEWAIGGHDWLKSG